jgi:alpha,alpha-trehalase
MTPIFDTIPLFEDVQLARVFPDGKTFVDCEPLKDIGEINDSYIAQKNQAGFELSEFIKSNFVLPVAPCHDFHSDRTQSVEQHINLLWPLLTRQPDDSGASLIPLPYNYVVPGGRFGEIYYWDSYFTMLGLKVAGQNELVEDMVNNFSYLIDTIGYIPNGNRTYYLGRSQPPFYSLMVRLLADLEGREILSDYLPQLEREYNYWMRGSKELTPIENAINHVVLMPHGEKLNRYWDENDAARPESYREDVELSKEAEQNSILYRHVRAGAESGWDYSSRWFADGKTLSTIHTADIIPVDLNCLLYHLEELISETYRLEGDDEKAIAYRALANNRSAAIQKYCWNAKLNFFTDYDFVTGQKLEVLSLAASFPLFFKIADSEQARLVGGILQTDFLKDGGLLTTLNETGQQWDAPNGWAPLQWMAVIALENYGYVGLAKNIAERWLALNARVYQRTGKLMEKYNVVDTELEAGGGEYQGQDGFGWTNGVFLALQSKMSGSFSR